MPHLADYPEAIRPHVEAHGAAKINKLSSEVLGYPALLITHEYESRALLARLDKEQTT